MKKDLKNTKVCKGCGAVLQTEDKNLEGYVKDLSFSYCLSCFNLKHYNKADDKVLKAHFPLVEADALVVYIVSTLHLNTLFKYDLSKFYPTQKVIILINKIDLLVKSTNFDLWVDKIKKDSNISLLEVMPISALKGHHLDIFLETLKHYNYKKVYFVGLQNSGKSTLLNKIAFKEENQEIALTAHAPGLTKDNIIYTYQDIKIIDTPGVYEQGYISDFLTYNLYHPIIPKKAFKPQTFQLNKNQSIIIGGLVIISFIKGKNTSFTFYLGDIKAHRTKYRNAYDLFNRQLNKLFKPVSEEVYQTDHFKLEEDDKYMINILDLGYLVVKGGITLEIHAPKGASILAVKGVFHGF